MLTAKEAREKIESLQSEQMDELWQRIEQKIEQAINQGRDRVSLDIEYRHHSIVKHKLKELGYTVNSASCQRDGTFFRVGW